ncbi:ring-1,2-phenylacetyl-CoA epoxidase subunit PaaE [Dyadobacter koreensis]|uniref:Ring-1,2-phenylacetyl-CoA epoxidase subunit PaaE n=1 Tax=Dyadobacter koreensis TaxID=408657 RepID=A0A1H6TS66_9BACT|nr:ferredoxin--NADP reductase [Dyadobacter koreensis]SEI81034.1 ring-1,2-phenylacetyl-CoA epoxidase subunit PaaE [Dyadobacter koreensis]
MDEIIDTTILLRVRQIVVETSEVKTFFFEKIDGETLHYEAGQFLTFLIEVNGREVRRSYSMSSAPAVDEYPSITVKRVPNGEISRFWIDFVHEGDIFTALPPAGRFTLEKSDEPRDVVLIGAGSGITPLFSILKQTLSADTKSQVTLLYANRNEKTTLFMDQISYWQRRYPDRLQVMHIHSQPSDEWNGIRGRINNTRLEQMVSNALVHDRNKVKFFICGPFELMRSAEITLHFMHFQRDQIRRENFVIRNPQPEKREELPHDVRLIFKGITYELHVPGDKTILQAALDSGIYLPYSCKGGSCATCAAICRSGNVYMTINDVLTDGDLAQGWILTCTAYPEDENVLIEII